MRQCSVFFLRLFVTGVKALLLIVAENDLLIPAELQREAFARAGDPAKALHVEPCGHFEIYDEPWFSRTSDRMVEWFSEHL